MRTRDIKPGFYLNDQLAECSFAARLAFPGLWMVADREGRLEYRPKRLKAEIFPYDNVDMVALLDELIANNLIIRYEAEGKEYLWIPTFLNHQKPHPNEKASEIPPFPDMDKSREYQSSANAQPETPQGFANVQPENCQGDIDVPPRYEASITKEELNPASSLSSSSLSHIVKEYSASKQKPQESAAAPPEGVADNSQNFHSGSNSRKKARRGKPPDEPYYQAKSGAYLTGKRLESFKLFWDAYDFPKGKAEAADAWLKIPELTDSLVEHICDAAKREAAKRGDLESRGQSPKWAQGWLSGRRWEDYEPRKPVVAPIRMSPPMELSPEEREKALDTMNRLQAERVRKKSERLGACLGIEGKKLFGGNEERQIAS